MKKVLLCIMDGVGLTKATMIKAALELGRRVASFKPNKYKVKNPWDIYKYYMDSLRYLKKEETAIGASTSVGASKRPSYLPTDKIPG